MANIIPAEYFGLSGLGASLQGIGQTIGNVTQNRREGDEIRRRRTREDRNQEINDALLTMQALPNNPEVWMPMLQQAGVVPEGTTRTPTSAEIREQLDVEALTGDPTSLDYLLTRYGTPLTSDEQRRGAIADVEQAEGAVDIQGMQLSELERTAADRDAFQTTINTPEFRAKLGIPDDVGEISLGTIEGIKTLYQLEGMGLDNALRGLQQQETRLNIARAKVQLDINKMELAAIQNQNNLPESDVQWLDLMSKATGIRPQLLAQATALVPSDMLEEQRTAIVSRIEEEQTRLRTETIGAIREASGTDAHKFADSVLAMHDANPDSVPDEILLEAQMRLYEQVGIPAEIVPATRGWFGSGIGADPARIEVGSAAEQLRDMLGGEAVAGERELSDSQVAADAVGMVQRFGGVEQALTELEKFKNDWSPADYEALRSGIRAQESTQEDATPEPPEPEAVSWTREFDMQELTDAKRRLDVNQRRLTQHVEQFGEDPDSPGVKAARHTHREAVRELQEKVAEIERRLAGGVRYRQSRPTDIR